MTRTACTPAAVATRPRRSLWQRLAHLMALRRSRARLAALDPHLLRDIGLSGAKAEAEARRPLWDVPPHWLR